MKYRYKFTILLALLLAAMTVSFFIGRYPVAIGDVLTVIGSKLTGSPSGLTPIVESVVWDIRIPRMLAAMFVGAGLAAAGSAYQGIFRNPLVSSDILGVSAASGFGAALGILLFGGVNVTTTIMSFAFGIGGVAVAVCLSRFKGVTSTVSLVLSGMVVQSLFNAGISMAKYMADTEEQLPSITFWLMGSLSAIRWHDVLLCAPIITAALIVLIFVSWKINLLALGDQQARSMGLRPDRLKTVIILAATVISAMCVCTCGTIGWVGLVIPHISRMIVGADYHKVIPFSIVFGAVFLLIIDDLTRSVSEVSIPLSILTAFVGGPFFAVLLRKSGGGIK